MKKDQKHFKGVVSAILVGTAVFFSSFTAFAYDDVKVWVSETEETEDFFSADVVFAPKGADVTEVSFLNEIDIKGDFLYESQFVDEEGNVYEISDNAVSARLFCKHQYVEGTISEHRKNSSGGCTVTYYNAKRCSKCGTVSKGEKIATVTYEVCNH